MKKKVIVLLGPTATGKSNLGIELAKIVGGEIISGDSVLVYQGLNIGSAKPSESEMSGIKHYMIDILSAEQNFDVLTFKQTVEELIESIPWHSYCPCKKIQQYYERIELSQQQTCRTKQTAKLKTVKMGPYQILV